MEWVEKGALYATSLGLSVYLLRLLRIAVVKKIPRGFRLIRTAMQGQELAAEARHQEHMAAMLQMSNVCANSQHKKRTKPRPRSSKKKRV